MEHSGLRHPHDAEQLESLRRWLREKEDEIARLQAELASRVWLEKIVERLRKRLAERLIDYCVCNNCNSPAEGCNCVACTTKRLEAEIERLRGCIVKMQLAAQISDWETFDAVYRDAGE